MFGLETLDVLIGLATVYLVFGIACTGIVEAVSGWFGMRSRNLEVAINEFLAGTLKDGEAFADAFFDHPLVQSLSKDTSGRPSYIEPETVGRVVESLLTRGKSDAELSEALKNLGGTVNDNRINGLLSSLVAQTGGDPVEFRKAVETHYKAVMERASGWYKRYTQKVVIVAAAVLVIGGNVDTFSIATSLSSNPTARAEMLEIANSMLGDPNVKENLSGKEAKLNLEQTLSDIENAGIQFGWKDRSDLSNVPAKIIGFLVSIFAISLGAPFWFDILQRFMQVRTTGKKIGS